MTGLCILSHGVGANGEPLEREAEHGLLCVHHRRQIDRLIDDIRDLFIDMAFVVEAGTTPKDDTPKTRHLKAAEAPTPANLEVLAVRDPRSQVRPVGDDTSTPILPVPAMIASWVLLIAEERPLTTTLPAGTLGQLDLLRRHADWCAAQEWVPDLLAELGDMRRQLSRTVHDQTHRRIGQCNLPASDRPGICGGTLVKENGSDIVQCLECRAQWVTAQEQARLALSLEAK